VLLELLEKRVIFDGRFEVRTLYDRDAPLLRVVVDELHAEVFFEKGCELTAKLRFRRMHLTVGIDELVDGAHELLLVRRIETFHDLEAAQLELRVNERVLSLSGGDGLGEELLHLTVDPLEDFVEVGREFLRQFAAELHVGLGHGAVYAVLDELPNVIPDEALFGRIEVAVDIAEGGEVEDDRTHLLVGGRPVCAERQHGPSRIRFFARRDPVGTWPPARASGPAVVQSRTRSVAALSLAPRALFTALAFFALGLFR
jgi:hypothetical protein